MLYLTEEDWRKCGIEKQLHRFFVLLWDEILASETPDSWQIRTCNLRSALEELLDAVQIASRYDPYKHNIPVLMAEIRAMLRVDPVASRHFPFLADYLPKVESAEHVHKDLPELERQVNRHPCPFAHVSRGISARTSRPVGRGRRKKENRGV
jgi:hypothetical protein